jgi:hypothetical protein
MNILNLIEDRLPNLHESLKNKLFFKLSELYPCKKHILYSEINSFKKENGIIAIGKFTRRYWESRGWPHDQIHELTKKNERNKTNLSSPMKVEHWLSKINPTTNSFYTFEEAKNKIRSHRKLNIEYWINLGFSEDAARTEVSKYQQENGNKFSKKNKNFPEKYLDRTWTQIGYWINLGYSYDSAKKIISLNQDKTSLFSFIKRYGEKKGAAKYLNFLQNVTYGTSIDYYISKYGEKEGPLRYQKYLQAKCPTRTSKESIKFFIPVYRELRKLGFNRSEIFWGIRGSKEYFLYDNSINSIFFYDFTIPKLNKIIEYHGTSFHPNPLWEKEKFNSWKCAFSNISAIEKLKIDQYKEEFAKKKGYDILPIWSDALPSYETIINFLIK